MDQLIAPLPRGVPGRALIDHLTPLAQFADPADILADPSFAHDPSKVFLGVIGETFIGAHLDSHMLTVAGSRQGKGRNVIIPNLLLYEGSVIVTDPKGELSNITARRRAEGMGQRVCVFDPFGITADHVARYRARWNPMDALDPDDPDSIETADLIADALVVPDSHDRHWSDSAQTLIRGVILHVASWHGYEGHRDLPTMRKLILHGSIRSGCRYHRSRRCLTMTTGCRSSSCKRRCSQTRISMD